MQDSLKNIFYSARLFFSGTALSRLSGLLRDIVTAFAFGTHASLAAFLEAFRFAHLFRRLLGEGSLQNVFAPHFEEQRLTDPKRAEQFFRDLCASLALLLIGLIGLSMIALGMLLLWGNLSSGNQEVIKLTFLMMPSLLFICLFGLNASLLQCEKSFFTSSVASVFFNLAWIAGALWMRHWEIRHAMLGLTFFVSLGCFLQWSVTLPETLKLIRRFTPFSFFSKDVRHLAKPLFLGIIGIAATQLNTAFDVVFARFADSQGPAFLWYAIRLQQLPLALFGVALSNAILPPLSRAIKSQNWENAQTFFTGAFLKSCWFMGAMTCGLFVLGDRCIDLIYTRGDFGESATIATTYCLWGYTLGLLPMALTLITATALYAQEDYRLTTRASLYTVCLNLALNGIFILILGWGAASVAWATGLSAWLNLGLLIGRVKFSKALLINGIIGSAFAMLLSGAVTYLTDFLVFDGNSAIKILQVETPHYYESFITRGMRLAFEGGLLLSVYYGCYWAYSKSKKEASLVGLPRVD